MQVELCSKFGSNISALLTMTDVCCRHTRLMTSSQLTVTWAFPCHSVASLCQILCNYFHPVKDITISPCGSLTYLGLHKFITCLNFTDLWCYLPLPLTSWWRKSSNMTVGQSSLISSTNHCYDWHPGSSGSWTCNQLTSKIDRGITGSRLRWSILT